MNPDHKYGSGLVTDVDPDSKTIRISRFYGARKEKDRDLDQVKKIIWNGSVSRDNRKPVISLKRS